VLLLEPRPVPDGAEPFFAGQDGGAMTCKQCGQAASYQAGVVFIQEQVSVYMGDRDEIVVTDAGLFCSRDCAVQYLAQTTRSTTGGQS
jgi:hypothetical protein